MAVIVLTVVVVLVVAVGVIVALAVTRRPADQWRTHLRNQPAEWTELEDEGVALDDVDPRQVSLGDMLASGERSGSGYIDPVTLPGYDHLESAAERIEGLPAPRLPQRRRDGGTQASSSTRRA